MKKLLIPLIFLGGLILTGCSLIDNQKVSIDNSQNLNQEVMPSDEEQIKTTLTNHFKLLGERKFGEDFDQYISQQDNPVKKDYVDTVSKKGELINGFNFINFNYIEIKDNSADTSMVVTWNIIANPLVNTSTHNQDKNVILRKEAGEWKIVWNKEE